MMPYAASRLGNAVWDSVFEHHEIDRHDFGVAPFPISAAQIRAAGQSLVRSGARDIRLLCKQDAREHRPRVFQEKGLFILPIKNGHYAIVRGEGYVDIPPIATPLLEYRGDFPFAGESSRVGSSEMQCLDRAYALSLVRHFTDDQSLELTIRGRKYTTRFDFAAGGFHITAQGVQTEVGAGYEGANQVVLIEAKGGNAGNNIIRQLYYPFRQWQSYTDKPVSTLFFQRVGGGADGDEYHLWHFEFADRDDYNSIRLRNSARYRIVRAGG